MQRRSFLKLTANATALVGLGELGFLSQLHPVSAAEAKLDSKMVRLHPEIEPLVRLIEDTPRSRLLEEIANRIHRGTTYREVLAALLLAGVRNIQPRPVGFKFHAVLVVNSAHLASLSSPDSDRWLPIFWALDQFKVSQADDVKQGDWTMGPIDEAAVPPSHKAKAAFIEAMDRWDESAADAAIVGLVRTTGAHELFEIFCRYGARDFREIGHKAIFVANSFRTLEAIGWHHAEPVLRSLAYALLDRDGAKENPSKADLAPDRPFRHNLVAAKNIPSGWLDGKTSAEATLELLQTIRQASPVEASDKVVDLLNHGVAPQSIFDALFDRAGEMLMRAPGILSLHASTCTNAMHYSWQHCRDEETRRLILLQNAAYLTLFRAKNERDDIRIDQLEELSPKQDGTSAIEEIFAFSDNKSRFESSQKILAYLKANPDPKPLADAARRLIFLKGNNSHDYKFSSAVLEDYYHLQPPWRDRFLAASVFNLKSSTAPDNDLVKRARSALNS